MPSIGNSPSNHKCYCTLHIHLRCNTSPTTNPTYFLKGFLFFITLTENPSSTVGPQIDEHVHPCGVVVSGSAMSSATRSECGSWFDRLTAIKRITKSKVPRLKIVTHREENGQTFGRTDLPHFESKAN